MNDGISAAARSTVDLAWAQTPPERMASWAAGHVDDFVRGVLRQLFTRRGVPKMSRAELERSLALLRCFTEPEVVADPDRLMAPAPVTPPVTVRRQKPLRGGHYAHLTFGTPYEPVHPVYAAEYRRYDKLDTVHLFAWQHVRPPPAQIVVTHGWGLGHRELHAREFRFDYLFRRLGLDVYYYVAPFHWLRKPSRARFSGELHPSPNLMRTNEAFVQTARELRTIFGLIKERSDAPLGMMGSSLGGYTTALMASIDDRLDFAIPVLPPASLADVFWRQGRRDPVRHAAEKMGMTLEKFRNAWALHCPLSHKPRVPWRGRLIVSAIGDRIIPQRFTTALWDHWERPRMRHFAGGHILQVYGHRYHKEVGRLLHQLGYTRRARG